MIDSNLKAFLTSKILARLRYFIRTYCIIFQKKE